MQNRPNFQIRKTTVTPYNIKPNASSLKPGAAKNKPNSNPITTARQRKLPDYAASKNSPLRRGGGRRPEGFLISPFSVSSACPAIALATAGGKKRKSLAPFWTTLVSFGRSLETFWTSLATFGHGLATLLHEKTAFLTLKTLKTLFFSLRFCFELL
ncbi:MAG: hypothetical protein ABFR90_08370 [Planctomycetota bacterium]